MLDLAFISFQQPQVPVNPEENDISFVDGDLAMVEGADRVFQDVAKILLTKAGSNSIVPTYGSNIPGLTGIADPTGVAPQITESVGQAIAFLSGVEPVNTPNETITGIGSLTISQPTNSPDEIDVNLVVNLQNGSSIQVTL
jgi:phage baseplate assembly protein W